MDWIGLELLVPNAAAPRLVCTLQARAARGSKSVSIIMLQASSERRAAGAVGLWVPGLSPGLMDAGSARAQEIARRHEEMLGMLRDLPESEYELSLTDLVEKAGDAETASSASERKEPEPTRSASGRQQIQPQTAAAAAGKPERRGSSSARRRESGSSFRSSSDGVLLNFYMPRSLTRSFTAPRPSRTPSVSGGRTAIVASDCNNNKRERDADAATIKCWPSLWDRPWRKSSRRDPASPPNDNVRAAILKAAEHSTSPGKV